MPHAIVTYNRKKIMCMALGQNVDYVTNTNFSSNWHLTYVAWSFVISFMTKKCSCICWFDMVICDLVYN
jgi:hypothetical protein